MKRITTTLLLLLLILSLTACGQKEAVATPTPESQDPTGIGPANPPKPAEENVSDIVKEFRISDNEYDLVGYMAKNGFIYDPDGQPTFFVGDEILTDVEDLYVFTTERGVRPRIEIYFSYGSNLDAEMIIFGLEDLCIGAKAPARTSQKEISFTGDLVNKKPLNQEVLFRFLSDLPKMKENIANNRCPFDGLDYTHGDCSFGGGKFTPHSSDH